MGPPNLEILSHEPPVPEVLPHDALVRFQVAFRRISVFAQPERGTG